MLGVSFLELFESSDFNLAYFLSDTELPDLPLLANMLATGDSPPVDSENVLDMVTQDMLQGTEYESTLNHTYSEMPYSHEYMMSAAPYTSAGDVFLPSMPITTASNTFVKPLTPFTLYTPASITASNMIVEPLPSLTQYTPASTTASNMLVEPLPSLTQYTPASTTASNMIVEPLPSFTQYTPASTTASNMIVEPLPSFTQYTPATQNTVVRPNPRPATSRQDNLCAPHHEQMVTDPFAAPTKPRKTTAKSSTKRSSSKPERVLTIGRSPSPIRSASRMRNRKASDHTSAAYSRGQSLLLDNASRQSAFVPASNRGKAETTHNTTRPADIVTESTVAVGNEPLTSRHVTVAHRVTRQCRHGNYTITDTTTYYTASGTQSPVDTELVPSTNLTNMNLESLTNRPTGQQTIISPIETANLSTSMLYTTPTINSRTPPTYAAVGRSSQNNGEQVTVTSTQSAYVIPVETTTHTSPSTTADELPRNQTRFVIPHSSSGGMSIVTTTTTNTQARVVYAYRTTQSACAIPTTTAARTVVPRPLTHSTLALSSPATARNALPGRMTRSQNASVTHEAQTYTIYDENGYFTTLTISPELIDSPAPPAQTALAQGVGSHRSTPDSTPRPRSQLFIPIENSKMNTSTSLSYLVTSPVGSDVTTRSSSATALTQSATPGSHTITAITTEALNKMRSRYITPVPQNVPRTTAPGSSSLPVTTNFTNPIVRDSVIIANPQKPVVTPNNGGELSMVQAAADMVRSLQKMYCLPAPTTSLSSSIAVESSARPVNRMVFANQPLNTTTEATSGITNTTTRAVYAARAPTPGTYIMATGMGSSTSFDRPATTISSRMVVPMMPHTATAARPFPVASGGTAYPSSIGNTDSRSRLPSRLFVAHTTDGSIPSSTTAFTVNRGRPAQSLYAIPSGTSTYTTSRKPSEAMTLIGITTTSAASPEMTASHNLLMQSSARSESTSSTICPITTPTTTVENTGNHYIIKLSRTPTVTANVSSVTTAVATPISTAAVSPTGHQFLEPLPVSQLRTSPAPRTYSVAQRSAAGKVVQRPASRNVIPRAAKRCLTSPAPLQIFTDVVCPPTNTQHQTTAAMPGHSNRRSTHTHNFGNSSSVVPQYKNTVQQPNPVQLERGSRHFTPRSSSNRLEPSVPVLTPRRSATVLPSAGHDAQIASTTAQRVRSRPIRFPYPETRSTTGRIDATYDLAAGILESLNDPDFVNY